MKAIILLNKDNTVNFMCNNVIPEGIYVDESIRVIEIEGTTAEELQGSIPPEDCVWDFKTNTVKDIRKNPELVIEYPDFDKYNLVRKTEIRRQQRDVLLLELDNVVKNPMRWEEFTEEEKEELREYRRLLRAVPEQKGFPSKVTWPKKPSVIK